MAVQRIGIFGGRVPKLHPRQLPDIAAQQALNVSLTAGTIRPWWKPKLIGAVPIRSPKSVFRYTDGEQKKMLAFARPTIAMESALVNDTSGRIYYSDVDGFFMTTKADIAAALPASRVGVPTPLFPQFKVHTQAGTPSRNTTRVYLATIVSKYGEESAPSRTFTAIGAEDGLWEVSGLESLIYDTLAFSAVTNVRLYRSISSTTGTDYRLVDEWAAGEQPAKYNDVKDDFEISDAFALSTLGWAPPPEGLTGVIPVSGGFNAGFFGRTVCFSVPYYPHAWPEDYQLRVDDDIVALGYYNNTIVVLTKGPIAYALGTTPDAMTLVRNAQVIPCLSASSVVSTTGAVLFASTEGLYMVSSDGVNNITKAFITRDEWVAMLPQNLVGAIYESRYLGFYTDALGFSLQFDDPNTAWTDVQLQGVSCIVTDRTANRPLVAVGTNVVEWDGAIGDPMAYIWRSKPLQQPKPCNFGALQLRGSFEVADPLRPVDRVESSEVGKKFGYNDAETDNEPVNGPTAGDVDNPVYRSVFVRVYGDGQLVWEGEVSNELPQRLPSGEKYHQWEIELIGSVGLTSVALASTIKALEQAP